MARLAGRVGLVSGGAEGLGKAIAQRLAADGARIIISDVQVEFGRKAASECGWLFLEHDVCDERRWAEVVEEVEARFGRLDLLVNNAGIAGALDAASPQSTRLEDWKKVFAINVEGVFLGCRAALGTMRKAGSGVIINMSSIAGLTATPYATAYGASKAAVRQLTKSVAQYCLQEQLDIRCNSVHPGNVMTALWEKNARERAHTRGISVEEFIAQAERRTTGGFSRAEDVAAVVAFLVSDEGRRMNGASVMVDGGAYDCDTYQAYLLSTLDQAPPA